MNYKFTISRERDFDFETELFFDRNRKEEIVKEMLEKGILIRV